MPSRVIGFYFYDPYKVSQLNGVDCQKGLALPSLFISASIPICVFAIETKLTLYFFEFLHFLICTCIFREETLLSVSVCESFDFNAVRSDKHKNVANDFF